MKANETITPQKFYIPSPLDGFEFLQPVDINRCEEVLTLAAINNFETCPYDLSFKLIPKDRRKKLSVSDAPWFMGSALFLREKAASGLIERYPNELRNERINCQNETIYFIRPRKLVPALDEQASEVIRFDSGEIMHVEKYVLKLDAVENKNIFVMSNLRFGPVIVSEDFVCWWKECRFSGIEFIEI